MFVEMRVGGRELLTSYLLRGRHDHLRFVQRGFLTGATKQRQALFVGVLLEERGGEEISTKQHPDFAMMKIPENGG